MPVAVSCARCGKGFAIPPCRVKVKNYCSIECAQRRIAVAERFFEKTVRDPQGCLLWIGAQDGRGYGVICVARRLIKAHRWSYEHSVGPIPAGMGVLHACDTPLCVEPTHLRVGTDADNVKDREERRRNGWRPRTPRKERELDGPANSER